MAEGLVLPSHRDGHCGYDPTRSGTICGKVATTHAWIGGQDAPDAYTVYACLDHTEWLRAALPLRDWHLVDVACLGTRRHTWIFSGTPGDSFCIEEEPVAELIGDAVRADGGAR